MSDTYALYRMIVQAAVQTYAMPPLSVIVTWVVGGIVGNWAVSAIIFNAVAERQFMRYFDACQDRIMNRFNLWYREKWDLLDANADSVRAFEASMNQQVAAVASRMDTHHAEQTRAWQEMTSALKAVQQEAKQTAIVVARIEGRMDEWKGDERRKTTRRNLDRGDE